MKTIRVKEKNASTIMVAIPGSQVVKAPPYTDWGVGDYLIPGRSGETWEDWGRLSRQPGCGDAGATTTRRNVW